SPVSGSLVGGSPVGAGQKGPGPGRGGAAARGLLRVGRLAAGQAALLDRYGAAFERYDMSRLVALLHDHALQSMPPYAMWIRGAREICTWMIQPGPSACRGSRLIPVRANGSAAFGQYRPDPSGGHKPWALQVIEISGGQICELHFFLDAGALFPA